MIIQVQNLPVITVFRKSVLYHVLFDAIDLLLLFHHFIQNLNLIDAEYKGRLP